MTIFLISIHRLRRSELKWPDFLFDLRITTGDLDKQFLCSNPNNCNIVWGKQITGFCWIIFTV